jgi:hypothetical protein
VLYLIGNGPSPTTAARAALSTGTALKVLQQIKPQAGSQLVVVEFGVSFDGAAAATPGKVELIEVDAAATVTALVAADIAKLHPGSPDPTSKLIEVGTSATGYDASANGTPTVSRTFDAQFVAPTNQYVKQFPLGREPVIDAAKFLQVRVHFSAAVNALSYVIVGPGR